MDNIKTLIVIPARSGSKGIVDKNIRHLGGKPLLAWTVGQAKAVAANDCLAIVSTDSDSYAELVRTWGGVAPFIRPARYANDHAGMAGVMLHALQWFKTEYGYYPKQFMCLQPTSPFRRKAHITQTIEWLKEVTAVVGCQYLERNLSTLFYCRDGVLEAVDKTAPKQTRRQDIQPLLTPNGAMYACQTEWFLRQQNFYPPNTRPFIMDAVSSLDIDTEIDWQIAEALIEKGLIDEN